MAVEEAQDTLPTTTTTEFDPICYPILGPHAEVVSFEFFVVSSLIFVIIGLVGHTFSILVFSSREMRTLSSNVYLLVLALSDSSYLISVFLSNTLSGLGCLYFNDSDFFDLFHQSKGGCIVLQYLMDLFADYSTCLILAFTIERFVSVNWPVRYLDKFTVFRSRLACSVLFLVIAVSILPYHIMFMTVDSMYKMCGIHNKYEREFGYIYITEAVVFRIIPVLTIAILNVNIILKMLWIRGSRHNNTNNDIGSNSHPNQRLCNSNANNDLQNATYHTRNREGQDKSFQLTVILILVSTSYIITYIPVLVHFLLDMLSRHKVIQTSNTKMSMTKSYTSSLYVCGFAINFFLYTMSGDVFRRKLMSILGIKPRAARRPTEETECTEVIPLRTLPE